MSKFYMILKYNGNKWNNTSYETFDTLPAAREWLDQEGDPERCYAIVEGTSTVKEPTK